MPQDRRSSSREAASEKGSRPWISTHSPLRGLCIPLGAVFLWLCCNSLTLAADKDALEDPLPRVLPTEPAAAEKTIQALDGFQMQLIAAEPLVMDPVAIAYDENGRAYVVEMTDYPYTDKSTDVPFQERTTDLPIGRVKILEDTDGDGRFDKSTIFADKLSWPTGIALSGGGAYVAGTPDIWYFKDNDGDGRADVRRKVFSGFRKFNVQAVINNLAWGLDHRIYGAGSSNGGSIQAFANAGAKPVPLARNDFSFSPRDEKFELLSGGARFGNCFDDWGNRFVCNIRNPAQHVLLPSRYLARNPYLPVPSAINDVSEGGDNIPVYRLSPPEPWRAVRAQRWAAEAGAHYPRSETVADGFITSTSGITVYRGAAYPPKYYGNLFMGEVSGNLVHRQTMKPAGVTFVGQRADQNTEFVRSTDNWFRPVNFINAPDGTLHVLDMYRETIEHPWSIPDDIKARVDLESGRDRGRIYRLTPPGFKAPKPPQLGKATTAELVATLANPNSWWRDTAHRLLYERQDKSAVEPLQALLRDSDVPLARFHALYSLDGLEALADDDLLAALKDREPHIRAHAVLLAEPLNQHPRPLVDEVLALSDDPDIRVRFQVAFTLGGALRDPWVTEALSKIARRDVADPWVRIAVLSSSVDAADALLADLIAGPAAEKTGPMLVFTRQLATVVGGHGEAKAGREVLTRLTIAPGSAANPAFERAVVLGLSDGLKRSRSGLADVVRGASAAETALLERLWNQADREARDTKASPEARTEAILLLAGAPFDRAQPTLSALVDPRQEQEIQMAAARALSGYSNAQVVNLLLENYRRFTPAMRAEVVELLLSKSDRIPLVLTAIKQGTVNATQISPTRKKLLLNHRSSVIREMAKLVLAVEVAGPRKEVIAAYKPALSQPTDAERGKKLFERECRTCHRMGETGFDVGPNLAGVRHRTSEEILTHVLDPNREVAPNFLQYVVVIDDGRVSTGIIASETATSITLKRAENVQETILRQNIEEISSTGTSLMPEGMEKKLTPQELADLIRYVLGK